MPLKVMRCDITQLGFTVDAIVNTANPEPIIGSGTDSAIHAAAGSALLEARKAIGPIAPGHAAVTPAFGLNAKYVIHAVSAAWQGGTEGERAVLCGAYDAALQLALAKGCRSVAFPLMAAGSYGFSADDALQVAMEKFCSFLMQHDLTIYLVVFSSEAYRLTSGLLGNVQSFIDETYVTEKHRQEYPRRFERRAASRRTEQDICLNESVSLQEPQQLLQEEIGAPADEPMSFSAQCAPVAASPKKAPEAAPSVGSSVYDAFHNLKESLADRLNRREETFTQAVLRIIDENGWTDAQVYNRVFMDRKLFSKIRNKADYQPKKATALLLAIALQLDVDGARDLLAKAGYTLTHTSKVDVIVEYFLQHRNYNILELDEVLYQFGQPTFL